MKIVFAQSKDAKPYLARNTVSWFRVIGLGCYLSWVFMLFYMTKAYPSGIDLRDMLYLNQTLSTLMLALGLLVWGFIATKKPLTAIPRPAIIISSFIMLAGSAFIIVNRLAPFGYVEQVIIVSGLLTGAGSSTILASWSVVIIPNTARTRLVECAAAFLISLINCFVLSFLPEFFTLLLILMTAAGSAALVIYCQQRTEPVDQALMQKARPSDENKKSIRRLAMRACTFAFFFGLIAGFVDVLSGHRMFSVGEYYDAVLLAVAALCVAAILFIALFVKHDALIFSYRVTVFLAIFGCMSIPFITDGNTYPNAIIAGSYMCIQIVAFALSGAFAKKYGIAPLRSFCAAFTALYAGESLGMLACLGASAYIPESTMVVFVITTGLAACLLFSYLFLFTEHDFINNRFSFSGIEEGRGDLEAAVKDPQDLYLEIAQQYNLTSRETDVFCLVVRGRSNARIQEELFISSGTVSTHINHIYRKFSVSNKQELLDIVQTHEEE